MVEISVVNGVKIVDEGNVMHFEPIEHIKTPTTIDKRSWLQKLKDWWNNSPVTPYVKVRDLADPYRDRKLKDPFDADVRCDGETAIEIGVKIKF